MLSYKLKHNSAVHTYFANSPISKVDWNGVGDLDGACEECKKEENKVEGKEVYDKGLNMTFVYSIGPDGVGSWYGSAPLLLDEFQIIHHSVNTSKTNGTIEYTTYDINEAKRVSISTYLKRQAMYNEDVAKNIYSSGNFTRDLVV